MTILFADLVGFTALAERKDPEQVKALVDNLFERLVADVTSFGGRVDKILGDAIVALFGAPVAHEDDAERAVRASLRMQRTFAEQVADLEVPMQMRIGVNTGEVLVGALRAGGDYTAMGDVVNTASRLQTVAPPGGVLVGPATHAATEDAVAYESVGDAEVRGREERVATWLAIEPLTLPGHRRRALKIPLVGRELERSLLLHTIRIAHSQRRAVLAVVEGDGGVGKTRLVKEVLGELEEAGGTVLVGACVPYGEANRWWPMASALAPLLDVDLAQTAPDLRIRLGHRLASLIGPAPDHEHRDALDRRAAAPLRTAVAAGRDRPGADATGARPRRARRPRVADREGSAHPRHRRRPLGQPAGAGADRGVAPPHGVRPVRAARHDPPRR